MTYRGCCRRCKPILARRVRIRNWSVRYLGGEQAEGDPPAAARRIWTSRAIPCHRTYDGIGPDEVLRYTGTEPFWGGGGHWSNAQLFHPRDQDGTAIAVERFAGRGGLAFSGQLDNRAFEMMVTPLSCSDGMSDRTYPFTVTLQVSGETRSGCGWSDAQPFDGPEHP